MWIYIVENYSYIAMAFGQRQVLLSLAGFILMLVMTSGWRHISARSLLPAWILFWIWMLPLSLLGSMNPGVGILNSSLRALREHLQHWLPLPALSPCGIPYLERMSNDLPFLPFLSWHKLVLAFWLAIAAGKAFSLLLQRKKLSSIAKQAKPIDDPNLLALASNWQRRFGLSRAVSVRSSHDCDQAFTIGIIQPVVFLPEHLTRELTPSDIEAVLGHELAHIKRYDDMFVCFQLITKSLLFFNPLIWLSARRITSLRERSCDLLAIQAGNLSPQDYAKSLLRIAELQRNIIFDCEVAAGLTSSALTDRVGDVLTSRNKRISHLPLIGVITGLLLLNIIFMPNLADLIAIRGSEAKTLLARLGAIPPMPRLLGRGNFDDNVGSTCGLPKLGHYHPGADFIPGADGDRTVHAIADGEIISVSDVIPYAGTTLRIKHAQDTVSTYVHLNDSSVKPGDHVYAGQKIGTLEGNHLHLEVRNGLRVIDPSIMLNQ